MPSECQRKLPSIGNACEPRVLDHTLQVLDQGYVEYGELYPPVPGPSLVPTHSMETELARLMQLEPDPDPCLHSNMNSVYPTSPGAKLEPTTTTNEFVELFIALQSLGVELDDVLKTVFYTYKTQCMVDRHKVSSGKATKEHQALLSFYRFLEVLAAGSDMTQFSHTQLVFLGWHSCSALRQSIYL